MRSSRGTEAMLRTLVRVSIAGLVIILQRSASARYGYPAGYGGYGWGGWGSTPAGSLARGLGVFSMGRGAHNEQTAVARSINADTVMRRNQFAYLSNQTALDGYHQHILAHRREVNRARAEIYDELRNHPLI